MRVLLVGGSGYVGTMVIPYLKADHQVRVLDLVPPPEPSVEFVVGSVADPAALRRSLEGIEGVVYMVMGRNPDGTYASRDIDQNYDLHVKGLHRVLHEAVEAGVERAVYTSTMSVHGPRPGGVYGDESGPCDARDVYGFTKRLGELVCEFFARVRGLTVVSLRLNAPVTQEQWQRHCSPERVNTATSAPDVASAISLGLTAPLAGSHSVSIAGDYEGRFIDCARARAVLGWEPRERPLVPV